MDLKKIGLLGGSFDPVHRAHIVLAETARKHLALDEVQLIPAADPWQRTALKASRRHRMKILDLAIASYPFLTLNSVEVDRGGKTYTIDTLEGLPKTAQYFWILGTDQLQNFCTWHRWEDILAYVHLVVANRPGTEPVAPEPLEKMLEALKKPLISLPFEPMAIAATEVRERLAHGQPVQDMLDQNVLDYIQEHHLYQT
ncbi:MAG TPA: nicotinate (nicotinamide) nucleotide adenylyltransferase [Pusillimonas sp.]|jgi:nicotinate-nucleotide adenylyltransferase|nr:nicotinate (nicotinamide) nucleotide adenylyltransferase [Pusillimonas sp.]HBT33728.1 nicotinate (nicotinamide) nucleotide adenylyltransferase [Pusillimonas sp.]HCN70727.1 nicotinate (nicotinamide) nucleotide adenylyltransferase [Pusillimonas sp.]HCP77539.1 nicotinate (nicotinamide) nucleotide adenylyltransferase [Pusillimonas sp.]|tara:strand:+ start:125943 stop:126539 length:597 start_codon:yes stop_codon:yes gene_type:complete